MVKSILRLGMVFAAMAAPAASACHWNSFGTSSNCDGQNPDVLGPGYTYDGADHLLLKSGCRGPGGLV